MALPFTVASLDAVPEPQRSLYVQRDGKYVLDVADAVPAADLAATAARLAEFRDNNARFLKALGATSLEDGLTRAAAIAGIDPAKLARLKDVDPDEYARLKASAEKLAQKGLGDPETADAKLKTLVDAALAPLRTQLEAEQKARSDAQTKAAEALFVSTVGDAFVKADGQPGAREFIAMQARQAFRVDGDRLVPLDGKYSAVKPGEPLSLGEWLTQQAQANPWAFKESKGSGAAGGRTPLPGTGVVREFRSSGGAKLSTEGITALN